MFNYLFIISVFFFVNLIFFYLINLNKIKFAIYDYPDNYRKLHKKPTPTVGGFFIIIFLLYLFILDTFNFQNIDTNLSFIAEGYKSKINLYIVCSLVFFLGYLDDKYNYNASKKVLFLLILIIGSVVLDKNLVLQNIHFSFTDKIINFDNLLALCFTIFCLFVFINALNMFDGSNGQLGIYSIILLLYLYSQNINLIYLLLIITLVFFLILNLNDKIFLGNNGSYSLGFLLSILIIKSYNNFDTERIYADEYLVLMFLPGFEMIRLFISRIINNASPFSGDRNHIHHLILKKFENNWCQFYLILFVNLGIVMFYFFNFFVSFVFSIIIYILSIIVLKKNND